VVVIDNGQSRYAIGLHLYDLGPKGGFRLVGLERPQATLAEVSQALAEELAE
jgi:hypothetical protein